MNKRLFQIFTWLRRRQGLGLRLILCWFVGLLALNNDEVAGHDQRFQLRGDQSKNSDIVIITLKPSDLSRILDQKTHSLISLNEITDITDSFYWDPHLWQKLLSAVIQRQPRAVGVSLYFGDNIGPVQISKEQQELFMNPLIFWSSTVNSLDRVLVPVFTNPRGSNLGSHEIKKDEDGVVRRVYPQPGDLPHLAEKLSGKNFTEYKGSLIINYRGSPRVFQNYSLAEVLNDELPENAFKDKIILIGAETSNAGEFLTPLGSMKRVEILAQLVDNLSLNRWIQHWPLELYALILLLVTIMSTFIIMNYPQSVAVIFYGALFLLIVAISAWCFDLYFLWIPTISVLYSLGTVWFIFVGYQASKIEQKHFHLQQEQKNMKEMEQLKNNFVSLISHDLKTPIAKIQGIVGRLQRDQKLHDWQSDFTNLQDYADELNRYIQSILKLLRVESSEFRLHKEAMDPNEVIEDAIRFLKPLAAQKNIQIQTDLEPLFTLEFDVTLIKEVIMNLIENAIKYSSPRQFIVVKSWENTTGVQVSVQDHGEGISAEDLPKVWGKFVRGKDQDLKSKGSGLGLYLVKYFIELHGGEISMVSQRGVGTTVSFSLPFESEMAESFENNQEPHLKNSNPFSSGERS